MIKIVKNNMIIDVCQKATYLRYIPLNKRFVTTSQENANAILGSDLNTTYHLQNTDFNFDNDISSVVVQEIGEEEYKKLTSELKAQQTQNEAELRVEVSELRQMVARQNSLLAELLEKMEG